VKAINCYLNFDGNTREAMTFYAKCLGAELEIQTFKEVGMDAPGAGDRVVHASIRKGGPANVIMASDTQPGQPFTMGNNVWLCVDCDDTAEQDRLFTSLGEGGQVLMPLDVMFWGARFGMLRDKFGVSWMFNCEVKKG
jgi:PhnB protein